MNLGTQKWKKARANFAGVRDDAGRCGVACTRACPWDAQCLPKACSSQGQGSPHGQAAKAWACSSQGQGSPPWAGSQGKGMQQPRPAAAPHGHAAKAWACSSQGQGSPPWALSRQGLGEHAASKAWASTQQPRPGRACSSQGRGVHAWARWHAPGRRQQGPWGHAGEGVACRVPEGQGQHGEGVACPVGGMPRPWHALGTPRRPWQHLGGLLLPSLDSLFGHLPTLPPLKSA